MITDVLLKSIADGFSLEEKIILQHKFDPLRKWIMSLPEKDQKALMVEYNVAIISFISGLRYGRKQTKLD